MRTPVAEDSCSASLASRWVNPSGIQARIAVVDHELALDRDDLTSVRDQRSAQIRQGRDRPRAQIRERLVIAGQGHMCLKGPVEQHRTEFTERR